MKKPTAAQMRLMDALMGGPKSYTTWGGKPWTATPARATISTILACRANGWIENRHSGNTVSLSLTEAGRRLVTHT